MVGMTPQMEMCGSSIGFWKIIIGESDSDITIQDKLFLTVTLLLIESTQCTTLDSGGESLVHSWWILHVISTVQFNVQLLYHFMKLATLTVNCLWCQRITYLFFRKYRHAITPFVNTESIECHPSNPPWNIQNKREVKYLKSKKRC
jgi:hypothetical protein